MAEIKVTEVVARIVDILTPLSSEERKRVISASLTLLGDEAASFRKTGAGASHESGEEAGDFSPRAQVWMRQNSISTDELQQVFHLADGAVEVIASEIPGKNAKEKTYSSYVLTGIARLLATGEPSFDDKSARALCKSSGCFNAANHALYLSDKGNEFTGTKEKGWTLTAPGLKRGAALVKELSGK
jgi:hypothetical protein